MALGGLVVAGCASVPEYKPAPGTPRARLTLERGEIQGRDFVLDRWIQLLRTPNPGPDSDYKLKYVADWAAKTCQMTLVRLDGGREALDPTARRRAPTYTGSKDKPGCN